MDPLSDVIALLRPHATFSKPITGRGAWGVHYAAWRWPSFSLVLDGRCWFAPDDRAPLLLERGDFVLLPATPTFRLYTNEGVDCVPRQPSRTAVRHGTQSGEPDFHMVGGTFRIEAVNAALLTDLLPEMIHIRCPHQATNRLARLIDLIIEECSSDQPGREMILGRLVEVMLVEALRSRTDDQGLPPGLVAGLRDPTIADTLRLMHSDVARKWTVADLAKHAGMSRSGFAGRFAGTVGCGPMEYLSRWRMSLAQDTLCRSKISLERLAQDVGYESASAFSTAFRKRFGRAPGAFARSTRDGHPAA